MTVAELIAKLQTMPQDVIVQVNDESNGIFHNELDDLFFSEEDSQWDEVAAVVLVVNPQ